MSGDRRTLLTGWYSFLHGEATAGDVLAGDAVGAALAAAGIPFDVAWSPGFRPHGLHLEDADPAAYDTLIFACGPVHSRSPAPGVASPILDLHERYAGCRRIAVGVSVLDPHDPAVTGFHVVLPRDAPGSPTRPDLALGAPHPGTTPVVGVVLTEGQHEYGARRRHEEVTERLTHWLHGLDAAKLPLETRLDTRDWRLAATPAQLRAVLERVDVVVTTRLHGLVLGLQAGVPVLAVDPVAGGAKVTAQADVLGWPAILAAEDLDREDMLLRCWRWCTSAEGRARAADHRSPGRPALIDALLAQLSPSPGSPRGIEASTEPDGRQ